MVHNKYVWLYQHIWRYIQHFFYYSAMSYIKTSCNFIWHYISYFQKFRSFICCLCTMHTKGAGHLHESDRIDSNLFYVTWEFASCSWWITDISTSARDKCPMFSGMIKRVSLLDDNSKTSILKLSNVVALQKSVVPQYCKKSKNKYN